MHLSPVAGERVEVSARHAAVEGRGQRRSRCRCQGRPRHGVRAGDRRCLQRTVAMPTLRSSKRRARQSLATGRPSDTATEGNMAGAPLSPGASLGCSVPLGQQKLQRVFSRSQTKAAPPYKCVHTPGQQVVPVHKRARVPLPLYLFPSAVSLSKYAEQLIGFSVRPVWVMQHKRCCVQSW